MFNGKIFTRVLYEGELENLYCYSNSIIKDIINYYLQKYLDSKYDLNNYRIIINGKKCSLNDKIISYINDINNNHVFELGYNSSEEDDNNDDDIIKENYIEPINMEINIEFFKTNININKFNLNNNQILSGLLKLCLLKKISVNLNNIGDLPKNMQGIIEILRKGKVDYNDIEKGIYNILKKIQGSNLINFSKYVDGLINQTDINNILIPRLNNNFKWEINYIQNCLGKYISYERLFQQEFERAKKDSIFEYSIISAAKIEANIDDFKMKRNACPSRVDRVLFHGTWNFAVSKILPTQFRKAYCIQHGNEVYFTEDLDSCWIYGSQENFKTGNESKGIRNLNIPKVGEFFTFIATAVYYDKNGYRRVYNGQSDPWRNGVNFAYAGMQNLETIMEEKPNPSRFYSTEYVINDLTQICPFMSFKLKRDEFCIIWRDTNFSSKPIYNNEFDEIFKRYLKERMKYITYKAKYNIYPCQTTEGALKLIERKKYNKIILISNIGSDYGGKEFIIKARQIIGNDVIALFNAYNIDHLSWIQKFPNALFSNQPKFYEKYLDCFYKDDETARWESLLELKNEIETCYKVKFNFNDKFLYYKNYLNNESTFNELIFNHIK